jgi:flavin reductase (DIM6/NTAB) family NADH-FMN oxidoreductase RutF
MIITWLSCADNSGGLILSVNRKRYSCQALTNQPHSKFTLSIPTSGMEDLILNIGSCSGRDVDKFKQFNLDHTSLREDYPDAVSNEGIVAVLTCSVLRIDDQGVADKEHIVLFAKATHAVVKSTHWKLNKCFSGTPSVLTFLGSKEFATMEHLW